MTAAVAAILMSLTAADLDRVEWLATDAQGQTRKITASVTGNVYAAPLPEIAIDRNARWVLDPGCNPWPALEVASTNTLTHRLRQFAMPSEMHNPTMATPMVFASSGPRTIQDPINKHDPPSPKHDPIREEPMPIGVFVLVVLFLSTLAIVLPWMVWESCRAHRKHPVPQADIDTTEDSAVHRELVEIGRQHNTDREEVGPWR